MTLTHQLLTQDCLEAMREMASNSIDSIVTDPPYGLSFMGKDWDHGVPGEVYWKEMLRIAKPGAHLVAFGGSRTYHRLAVAIEDAGWEIRDCIMWVYGGGFPKSLNISKALDKKAGVEPEVIGHISKSISGMEPKGRGAFSDDNYEWKESFPVTQPASDEGKKWAGWFTALKPSYEPIILARKPISTSVADNVLQYGTGGLNIDACRVESNGEHIRTGVITKQSKLSGDGREGPSAGMYQAGKTFEATHNPNRYPANLIHDGSDEVLAAFPHTSSRWTDGDNNSPRVRNVYGGRKSHYTTPHYPGSGSAARFFYCAKASASDRGEDNNHPTVKPNSLMRYLCRLVTPPGGLVLDPFMGSGSTGKAAVAEGFQFLGVEKEENFVKISESRIQEVVDALRKSEAQASLF